MKCAERQNDMQIWHIDWNTRKTKYISERNRMKKKNKFDVHSPFTPASIRQMNGMKWIDESSICLNSIIWTFSVVFVAVAAAAAFAPDSKIAQCLYG